MYGLLLAIVGSGVFAADKELPADLKKMQGSWYADKIVVAGTAKSARELQSITLKVEGNKSTFSAGGTDSHGDYEVRGDKDPKQIDITVTDGDDKGKKKLGIYKFDGDGLIICLAPADSKERPTAFESTAKNGWTLESWNKKE